MAGKKGKSGRFTKRHEIQIDDLCRLAVSTVKNYLEKKDAPLEKRAKISIEVVKKYMPTKLIGEGFDNTAVVYNVIQDIQRDLDKDRLSSMVLDRRDGMDTGRA
jgi:hypothetical protein